LRQARILEPIEKTNREFSCKNLIPVLVNCTKTLAILDTGASVSCISMRWARKLNIHMNQNNYIQPLFAADGGNLNVMGSAILTITLGNCDVRHVFYVVKNLNHSVLFGIDFLQKTHCYIDFNSDSVSFCDGRVLLPLQTFQENSIVLRATKFISIPAKSQAFVLVKMAKRALSNFWTAAIVEPHVESTLNNVSVARMFINKPQTERIFCRMFNCDTQPRNILRYISVAVITPLSDESDSYYMGQARANGLSRTDGSQQLQSARAPHCSRGFLRQEKQQENCQQQACTLQNKTARSNSTKPLQQKENTHTADMLSSSETQDVFTLADKIKYLKSKNLLNDSQEIEPEVYPQFVSLLYEHRDIFAHSAKDITECNVMECDLLLEDNTKPVRSRPYRLSDDIRKVVDKQLDELLEAGVIAESDGSQFASPIIIVKKRDGSARFCLDMRKLNSISKPLFHELPLLEDIIDVITRNKAGKLSLIDLCSAYHQIKVSDKSSYQTTFVTPHRGAYRYLRLLQGHRQSPYYMCLVLNKLFRNEIGNFLIIYLDDLLACSENTEKHLQHLRVIFERFRQGNLKLHPSKCHFFQHTVKYLGFIFSPEGVKSDPEKTAAIRAYQIPKRQKNVRSFLAMANFFRRYIKDYSETCYPLYRLLQKKT